VVGKISSLYFRGPEHLISGILLDFVARTLNIVKYSENAVAQWGAGADWGPAALMIMRHNKIVRIDNAARFIETKARQNQ
jgi:hypothetical protein